MGNEANYSPTSGAKVKMHGAISSLHKTSL